MNYRADIDGLRALAILLVTIFHFDLFSVGKAGFIGVDVFFVISGFLITGIILRGLEAGRFHFGTFLYRRVRRLYPALLATLVLYLIVAAFLMLPGVFVMMIVSPVAGKVVDAIGPVRVIRAALFVVLTCRLRPPADRC